MTSSITDAFKQLMKWSEKQAPDFIKALPESQQQDLVDYVQSIVDFETDGFDELYEGMAQTMKYVPKFVIVKMSVKFMKPAIAAGVTAKLSVAEATKLTPQFPIDYAGDIGSHLESAHAAAIFSGLKGNIIEKLLEYMVDKHPAKALDVGTHLDKPILKKVAPFINKVDKSVIEPDLLADYQDFLDMVEKLG